MDNTITIRFHSFNEKEAREFYKKINTIVAIAEMATPTIKRVFTEINYNSRMPKRF